jgi:hypothetical protein
MTAFQCIPITTETAGRFRRTGQHDHGNQVRRIVAPPGSGFPCRHCLRLAEPGETCRWGPAICHSHAASTGRPARSSCTGPPAPRAETVNEVAPIVRANSLVSVRACDVADQCLYDLGQVCTGKDVDGPLERALGDPRTAFVNIHTARPGCLLSLVRRIPDPH